MFPDCGRAQCLGNILCFFLLFRLVYGELRERESDTFFIECLVDNFVDVVQYIPVVGALYPDAYRDIDAACAQ